MSFVCYAPPSGSSGARDLIIGRVLHLFPQFVHASSVGYGETAGVHRLYDTYRHVLGLAHGLLIVNLNLKRRVNFYCEEFVQGQQKIVDDVAVGNL